MNDSSQGRRVTGGFSGNSHDRRLARRKQERAAAAKNEGQVALRTKLPNGATFTQCRPAGGTIEPEVNHVIAERGGI